MKTILDGKEMVLGACYYPEHWKEELWREDLARMLEAGIRVIRIAEFAWNKVELQEGVFDYTFFDRFLDAVEETPMKVIFCTPTATPPAWLTKKYPEVLNATKEGVLYRHGARRHYNYNSAKYRELCAAIVEAYASHYAGRSCIIGWQIDNELNCETDEFYSEADTLAFRAFLREKYGSLEALNEAWGTVFWNQTYTSWEEIYVPRTTIHDTNNPHEVLDYKRFISHSCRSFALLQAKIIRRYAKEGDFITTNGIFGNLDTHQLVKESLDFLTYDSYPNFAFCLDTPQDRPGDLKDRKWSRNLSLVRSMSPVFGIMEQQTGANGWNTRMEAPTPRPGQISLWALQSIAHGADFVSFFRWRTCPFGTEMYWHGILDYSGRENRRLREVRELAGKAEKLAPAAGARYEARLGIVKDYDNEFDAQVDVWHRRIEEASLSAFFAAAQRTHTPFDYVYLDHTDEASLARYDLLIYPHPCLMTAERAALLEGYCAQGGTLVVGCRSAYKDGHGKCVTELLPGLLADLTGADVPEYSFIAPDAERVSIDWEGRKLTASVFMDMVKPLSGAEQEAVYEGDVFAGEGALVSHAYGKGKAYYYGSAWNEESARVFLEKLGAASPYGDLIELPEGAELAVREKEGRRFLFVLNYQKEAIRILLKKPGRSLFEDREVQGELTLPAYGTMAVEVEK